jgi:predicted RNase H-like HicB family nuclease
MKRIVRRWDKDWKFFDGRGVAEEVFRADIGDGTVYVYKIEPDEYHSGDTDFTDFYIAIYHTGGFLEPIWGFGETPEEALENAERKYGEEEIAKMNLENRTSGYFNPFTKALEMLKEKEDEDEDFEDMAGMFPELVDVEGVLRAYVEDGIVKVYEIKNNIAYHKLPFDDFYIATLYASNGAGGMEKTWGFGETPEEALENAERKWDDLTGGYLNPFTKALEMLKEDGNNVLQNY